MEKTVWTDFIVPAYPEPGGDINVDVAIIGGGLAGIMAAEAVHRAGHTVAVFEADCVGGGETARSSAMVSYAHDNIYSRLISKHGLKTAKKYLMLNKRGLDDIRGIIKNYSLACGWRDCDMVLFATTDKGRKDLLREREAYEKLGEHTELTDKTELPFKIKQALRIKDQGMLNPYRFVTALAAALAARGVLIYENARVGAAPDGQTLKVAGATVHASRFIVATHYPYIDIPGWYFMKMYQSRSHNIAFRCDAEMKDIYESIEDDGYEYRPIERGIIMCGGAPVRTGKNGRGGCYDEVRGEIKRTFGATTQHIVRGFSAQDCITHDMMPFVGHYGGELDNVYVITGFNKWGFTSAAAAAELICGIFAGSGRKNIFDPARVYMLKAPIKAIRNFGAVAAGYMSVLFTPRAKSGKELGPGEAVIIKSDGKRLGVYMRADGNMDVIDAKCPHLGCGLKWNADDKSWDCPCHGSRFDTKGNIISSPASESARTDRNTKDEGKDA